MKTKLVKSIVLASVTGLLAAGCEVAVQPPGPPGVAVAGPEVEVDAAPPPPPEVDIQPVSPGPDFVWIGGTWVWGPGGRWVWQRGRWDRPPHPGAVWVPHRYEYRNGRHVFVRGGWR